MYLDGKLLDVVPLREFHIAQGRIYLQSIITQLEKRHELMLSGSDESPSYILSGVPSSISGFTPLTPSDLPGEEKLS